MLYKIVITGGPCAGKSSSLSHLREVFTKRGYTVLIMNETATELIQSGVTPKSCGTLEHFQKVQMQLQLAKELAYETAAKSMKGDVLLFLDRGGFDSRAYMSDESFLLRLSELGVRAQERLLCYDGVFHLETAAKGALPYYTTANNSARTETPEAAVALDERVLLAWRGHPYHRVIPNGAGGFEEKLSRLVKEISDFLAWKEKT